MIYPEPGLADQYWIPWWIILIAVLTGILLLTLLVYILWKVTHTCAHTGYLYLHLVTQALHKPSCPEYFVFKVKNFRNMTDTYLSSLSPHWTCEIFSSYPVVVQLFRSTLFYSVL